MKKRKKHTLSRLLRSSGCGRDVELGQGRSCSVAELGDLRGDLSRDGCSVRREMKSDEAKRLKELRDRELTAEGLLADAELDKAMLKEALRGKRLSPTRKRKLFSEFKKSLKYLNVGMRGLGFRRSTLRYKRRVRADELSFANVFWNSFDSDRDLAIDVSHSCFALRDSKPVTNECIEYGVKKD